MKQIIFCHWFKLWFVAMAAASCTGGAVYANGHWFPSKDRQPAITKAEVVEVDQFDPRCSAVRAGLRGCYIPEQCETTSGIRFMCQPGRIEIAKRMTPWERECVIRHERMHEAGLDHTHGWSDCW